MFVWQLFVFVLAIIFLISDILELSQAINILRIIQYWLLLVSYDATHLTVYVLRITHYLLPRTYGRCMINYYLLRIDSYIVRLTDHVLLLTYYVSHTTYHSQ